MPPQHLPETLILPKNPQKPLMPLDYPPKTLEITQEAAETPTFFFSDLDPKGGHKL
jgi:hypothetical protein